MCPGAVPCSCAPHRTPGSPWRGSASEICGRQCWFQVPSGIAWCPKRRIGRWKDTTTSVELQHHPHAGNGAHSCPKVWAITHQFCATTCSLRPPERRASFFWAGSIFGHIWKISDRSLMPKERWCWSKLWFLQQELIGVWGSWHFWACIVKHPLKSGIYSHRKYINRQICDPSFSSEGSYCHGNALLAWNVTESVPKLPLLGCVLGLPTPTDAEERQWADHLKSLFRLTHPQPHPTPPQLQVVFLIIYFSLPGWELPQYSQRWVANIGN